MSLLTAAENAGVTRSVRVQSPDGDLARTVELPPVVFDVPVNVPLIHQVVVAQLAAARQGTHSTKTRGEVSGGGKKPYRQKGTGRARQGSIRAPQFTGGGVVHGPTPRSYDQRTPKKMKAAALRGALSDRARHGRVHIVAGLTEGDVPSTKVARRLLEAVVPARRALVVAERNDTATWLSVRNLAEVHLLAPGQLNTYDVLVADDVVFTEGAYAAFLAGPPKGKRASAVARESELDDLADAVDTLAPGPVDDAPAEKPKRARATAKKKETAVSETPATDAGTTKPAGGGESDAELVDEVAEQTSSDVKAEGKFEREADGAKSDTEAAKDADQ